VQDRQEVPNKKTPFGDLNARPKFPKTVKTPEELLAQAEKENHNHQNTIMLMRESKKRSM
jgi:hypothetical protein